MLKKYLKTGCTILMGVVLVFNLLTMALSGLGLREQLNWLPGAVLNVNSGSMEPILSEGDLLVVREIPYERLEVGDLVTFHGNNELVTHQIVREEDGRFVTRGIANDAEDPSIGPEEYCAKVALVIPGAGRLLEVLTVPSKLVLLVVLVLSLFYGPSLLIRLADVLAGEAPKPFRIQPLRLMGTGMIISLMCTTPFVTAAKYTANINEYASVSAGATYLTSNYLSEEGNYYDILGWNGSAYALTLYVRNYENDLLFNKTGNDLSYQIEFNIVEDEGYETDYSISLWNATAEADGKLTPDENGKYGPFSITGDVTRKSEQFEVTLETTDGTAFGQDEKIRFQIILSTNSNTDFDRKLTGTFTLVATEITDFLSHHGHSSTEGSALVTYSFKTELVEGATTRDIEVKWNNKKMYLNEYESTAANVIANEVDGEDRYSPGTETEWGYLRIPLHSYSSVNLQFFKYNSSDPVYASDFECKEVKPDEE